jgi:hypothetical protein
MLIFLSAIIWQLGISCRPQPPLSSLKEKKMQKCATLLAADEATDLIAFE